MIPMPPSDVADALCDAFAPAPDMGAWARETFIAEDADLLNEDHAHLRAASLGFLWTNVGNTKKGRMVIGQAEPGAPQGAMGKWSRARAELQVAEWFGTIPDFIITLQADWWLSATDPQRCALVEHELYHCAQATDAFGAPKFNKQTGRPSFTMRGHDVEEFVGVVRRYGATTAGVQEMVDAAQAGPEIGEAEISSICGVCLRAA
ncbi:putative metallopeptidase [Alloyangia pacifica]|uniref:putative metallopeptidase n=1 Tax=Alloyangia pacifica TaxID=311180 RepID=UPI0031DE237F